MRDPKASAANIVAASVDVSPGALSRLGRSTAQWVNRITNSAMYSRSMRSLRMSYGTASFLQISITLEQYTVAINCHCWRINDVCYLLSSGRMFWQA